MDAEVHRLFFALWPDEATRAQLAGSAAALKQRLHPTGRWIGAHRYHLTLNFLGDHPALPEPLAARAMEAAQTVRAQRFALRIEQAGSFNNRAIPWWLGPAATPAELRQLWLRLRDALRATAVPYDAKLRLNPHITVLRDGTQLLAVTPVPVVEWAVRDFALIHSVLGARSEYRVLGHWPLLESVPETPAAQRDLWENDAPE